jgi:hypothetical protein
MSDKPILAEIVRADQIRVGDRIVWCDARVEVKTIERGDYYGNGERIQFNALGVDNLLVKPSATVARTIPEPVEVRDQWLVEYFENGMQFFVPATDRDHAFEVAKTIKSGVSVLCERQSIISRQEVQS